MGISPVAVYSECDRAAAHVRMADEAYAIGGNAPREGYLRIDRLIEAAQKSGADAVHPGYGFLSENAEFARAVRDAGLRFIGPTPEAIAVMGSKTMARQAAERAGVAIVPGTVDPIPPDATASDIEAAGRSVGFPLIVKAVSGGGGKGMRTVVDPAELADAVRAARSEADSAFGDAAVYLERRLTRPRHIEIQVLGDEHGTIVPFVERECSIQRRHQKVVEESPSPAVGAVLRRTLTEAAKAVCRAVAYTGAGTIEFLVDDEGRAYFLEMNTRLQVEHAVTEMVTGVDLVHWQIRVARGERLDLDADALLAPRGHAVECRIYAEDPDNRFLPSPGRIVALEMPAGPGIRVDSAAAAGFDVPVFYDPMIAKLVAWGENRTDAIHRMERALGEYVVGGVATSLPFFVWLFRQPAFLEGRFDTTYLDAVLLERQGRPFLTATAADEEIAAMAAAIYSARGTGAADGNGGDGAAVAPSRWKTAARAEALGGVAVRD